MNEIIVQDINNIVSEPLPWEKLRNKTILITGARGGMASYLIYSLLELNKRFGLGCDVVGMCRSREKSESFFREQLSDSHFTLFINDVADPFDASDIKADVIIHAANSNGIFSSARYNNPYSIFESNVAGFNNVIKAAAGWDTGTVIVFSSAAVYGTASMDVSLNESFRYAIDFANPDYLYCTCKQMLEAMANTYSEQYKKDVRIIRPFTVFGPGMGGASKGNHMTDFIRDYLAGDRITMHSQGTDERSYCYVSDAVSAVFYIWLLGDNTPYNVGTGSAVSIRQFAETVSAYKNKNVPVVIDAGDSRHVKFSKQFIGSNEKLRALGWSEKVPFADAVHRTIEWAGSSDFADQ